MPRTRDNPHSPRQERHEITRQAILDAALLLIEEGGVQSMSLREVARRVKYSPAALYEYFASKDDILTALGHEADRRLTLNMQSVAQNQPFEPFLLEIGLAYIRFAVENPGYFRLMFTHFASARTSPDEPPEGSYAILINAVQRGVNEAFFHAPTPAAVEHIAYSLWSMVHGMATLQTSYLRTFQSDFTPLDRQSLLALLAGLRTLFTA